VQSLQLVETDFGTFWHRTWLAGHRAGDLSKAEGETACEEACGHFYVARLYGSRPPLKVYACAGCGKLL
jgi:hypothetical protein